MSEAPELLLHHHLKKLRLPTFLSDYEKLAKQCAAENRDHVQYLLRLSELELIERERRMIERRIRAARFPAAKSLDSFDFKAMASLNKPLVMELARCQYIEARENVIALGPSGTGKTHIALGLGLAACQKGLKVRFITAAELLFETISQCYERGSVIITSNLPFDEWTEIFGSERLTGALLDRLTHHVHILEMNGESFRLKQSQKRRNSPKTEPS